MISELSLSLVLDMKGALYADAHVRSDCFARRRSRRLSNRTEAPTPHTGGDVPGTLPLRFMRKTDMNETGLFFATVSQCLQGRTNEMSTNKDDRGGCYRRFWFPQSACWGAFLRLTENRL